MYFYSLSDRQLLRMPIRRFWLLEKNVDRLRAESDLRQINVVAAPQSRSGTDIQQRLVDEMGTIIVAAPKRDEDAMDRLRALSSVGLR